MWPKVEVLEIRRSVGLTMSMVPKIVSQHGKLKELSLPGKMAESDPKLAAKMLEDLGNRPSPVRLSFTKGRSGKSCSLLPDFDEGSADSNDSDDDYQYICENCTHSKTGVKRVRWRIIFLWVLNVRKKIQNVCGCMARVCTLLVRLRSFFFKLACVEANDLVLVS